MNKTNPTGAYHNPFSTRRVRPGALPFLFPPGENYSSLVDRLAAANWRGAIIGAHGSGKSTLLESLVPEFQRRGQRVILVALHDGERSLPIHLGHFDRQPTLLIVDGYEQLGRWSRLQVDLHCRRREWGLLVTAHEPVRLPTLWTTSTTPDLAQKLLSRLVPGETVVPREEISQRLAAHRGNLRDLFFDLYDVYEARRRGVYRPG